MDKKKRDKNGVKAWPDEDMKSLERLANVGFCSGGCE